MRTDTRAATELARSFLLSNTATLWLYVTDDVRSALVDQIIMGHIRMAYVVENTTPITPTEIVYFRALVINALAKGVRRGGAIVRCVLEEDAS